MFSRLQIRSVPKALKKKLNSKSEHQGITVSKIIRQEVDIIIKKYDSIKDEPEYSRIDIDNISTTQKKKLQVIAKKLGVTVGALVKIEVTSRFLDQKP